MRALHLVRRRTALLDESFEALVRESDEIVRILGKVVSTAAQRKARDATKSQR